MKTILLATVSAILVSLIGFTGCEQGDSGKVAIPEITEKETATEKEKTDESVTITPLQPDQEIAVAPTFPGASPEITVSENITVRDFPTITLSVMLDVVERIIVRDTPTVTPSITVTTPPVTLMPQLLSPPKLVSPGSGSSPGTVINSLTPTLQWSSVSGAENYGIYIFDIATKSLIFDSKAKGIQLKGTNYTLPSQVLQWGKSYYWYMNSYNSAGWGSNSTPLYFQTQTLKQQ